MPESKFVEATQSVKGEGFPNWGKFMLLRFTPEEWSYRSALPLRDLPRVELPDGQHYDDCVIVGCSALHTARAPRRSPLLIEIGTNPSCIWVLDLQTHEGASFMPRGLATADLNKHRIWVCPMFEPFLQHLYKFEHPFEDCPALVELPEAPGALFGYRRPGPEGAQR